MVANRIVKFVTLILISGLLASCASPKKWRYVEYRGAKHSDLIREEIAKENDNKKHPLFAYDSKNDVLYLMKANSKNDGVNFRNLFHVETFLSEKSAKNIWPLSLSRRLDCVSRSSCELNNVECTFFIEPVSNKGSEFFEYVYNRAFGIASITFFDKGTEYEKVEIKSYFSCEQLQTFLSRNHRVIS